MVPALALAVKQAEVFSVGIRVPDDRVEDCRIEQFEHLDGRPRGGAPHEIETRRERRAAFRLVLVFRNDPKESHLTVVIQPFSHHTARNVRGRPFTMRLVRNGSGLNSASFGNERGCCVVICEAKNAEAPIASKLFIDRAQ